MVEDHTRVPRAVSIGLKGYSTAGQKDVERRLLEIFEGYKDQVIIDPAKQQMLYQIALKVSDGNKNNALEIITGAINQFGEELAELKTEKAIKARLQQVKLPQYSAKY